MRFNGQPFDSASSIRGSSFAWSRTTPETTSRKNAASAGRYLSPSTSPPSQWLSNSARTSLMPAPAMSIWYSACTAASRAAPRRLALRSVVRTGPLTGLLLLSAMSASRQTAFDAQHGERGPRGIAALVHLGDAGSRPHPILVVDGQDAVAEGQAARHRKIHQRPRGFLRHDLEMDGVAADHTAERN